LLPGTGMDAHEVPAPPELLTLQREVELTLLQSVVWIPLRMPVAAVPDQHRAAAVFALGNGPLERVVLDRMILHLDREPLLAGNEARPASDRPALHDAVELEPQIVVQAARGMLLDDELVAFCPTRAATRLWRDLELALFSVDLETHR